MNHLYFCFVYCNEVITILLQGLCNLVLYPCPWTAFACLDPKTLQRNIVSLTHCGCHCRFSVKKYAKVKTASDLELQRKSLYCGGRMCEIAAASQLCDKLWGCWSTAVLHPAVNPCLSSSKARMLCGTVCQMLCTSSCRWCQWLFPHPVALWDSCLPIVKGHQICQEQFEIMLAIQTDNHTDKSWVLMPRKDTDLCFSESPITVV